MGLGWFKGKQVEADYGPFVPYPCPHCGQKKLHLFAGSAPSLLGLLVGAALKIRCVNCSHSIFLQPYETEAALNLKKHADAFRAGELSEEQFAERLDNSGLLCLRELAERAEKWTCPKCGEQVPPTFDVCWKCQAVRDDGKSAVDVHVTTAEPVVHADALFGASPVVMQAPPADGAGGNGGGLPPEDRTPGMGRP
jgi:predicted RNA-binding Zn-ribbon protein involved in translation (DUF1610 family)